MIVKVVAFSIIGAVMARLVIGVDVTGVRDVERLSTAIKRAETSLHSWVSTSSKVGEGSLAVETKLLDAAFITLAKTAQEAAKKIDLFFRGPKSTNTAAILGEVEAIKVLESAYGKLAAAQGKQLVLSMPGYERIESATKAINDNIAAYKRLNSLGEIGSNYSKYTNYAGLEERLKREDAAIEAHVAHLKDLETEERKLQRIQNEKSAQSMSYGFKGQDSLRAGTYAAQIKAEEALYDSNTGALKKNVEALAEYDKVSGRLKNAGAIKDAFNEQSTASKSLVGRLKELGQGWDEAGGKSKTFHSLLRGAAGASGQLWLSYGKGATEIAAITASFATVAATLKTIKVGAEFDDLTRKVVFLNNSLAESDRSGSIAKVSLQELKSQVLGLTEVVQKPTDLAAGLLEFSRAGVSAAEALKPISQEGGKTTSILEQLSAMAYYSGMKVEDLTKQVLGYASAYNENVINVANTITKIADVSNADIKDMMEAFKNAASLNTLYGESIYEVAAALGVMHDKGIKAATAGSALTTAVTKLMNPTEKVKEVFNTFEFSAIDKTTGKVKDLSTMFKSLAEVANKLPESMRGAFLEEAAGLRGLKAIASQVDDVSDSIKKVGKASDGTSEFLVGFVTKLDEMKKKAVEAGGDAGKKFTYLQEVMVAMGESGKYNLDLLLSSVENLFLKAYDNASVVKAMKDFREVVTDPATVTALTTIITSVIQLMQLASKAIVITVRTVTTSTSSEASGAEAMASTATDKGGETFDYAYALNAQIRKAEIEADRLKEEVNTTKLRIEQLKAESKSSLFLESTLRVNERELASVNSDLDKYKAQLEGAAKAAEPVVNSTNKQTEAVRKLTTAQAEAQDQALKTLEANKEIIKHQGDKNVDAVNNKIKSEVASLMELWRAAGKVGDEYKKLESEAVSQVTQKYAKELEAAKKKDLALTADQIQARRAEAAANKEASIEYRRLSAEMYNVAHAATSVNKSTDEWLKSSEKSISDLEHLYERLGDSGMSSDEKYIFKMTKEYNQYSKAIDEYYKNSNQAQVTLNSLKEQEILLVNELNSKTSQISSNIKLGSEGEREKALTQLNDALKENRENQAKVNETIDQFSSNADKAKKVLHGLYEEYRDKSVFDSIDAGLKEAVYSAKEMADDIQKATERAFGSMTDAIVEFVKTGKLNFKDMADSIITDLLRIVVRANFTNQILAQMGYTQTSGVGYTYTGTSGSGSGSGSGSTATGTTSSYGSGLFGIGSLLNSSGTTIADSLSSGLWDYGFSNTGLLGDTAISLAKGVDSLNSLLGTTGSSALFAGVGSLALSALTGNLNTQSVFQAGGAAIGSIWGPVGSVAGSVIGSLIGGLFGDDKNYFGFDPKQTYGGAWNSTTNQLTSTYDKPTTDHWSGAIFTAYGEQVVAVQKAFNEQVTALAKAFPEEAANVMTDALANVDYKSILSTASAGKWDVEDAQSAIEDVISKYSDAMLSELGKAVGAGVTSYLDNYGASGLVGSEKVWNLLTDAVQENIETAFKSAAETISGGDYETGFSAISSVQTAVAAIASALEPIQEILDTDGLSEYSLALRSINIQFDDYATALKEAGVDLAKYTDLEEARAIAIQNTIEQYKKEALNTLTGSLSSVTSALSTVYATVKGFETVFDTATTAVADAKKAISDAYFSAVDEQTAAQQNVNDLLQEASDNLRSFSESITEFLTSISSETSASAGASLTALKEQFMVTASAAGAGDTDAQSALLTQAQDILDKAKETSSSGIEYARVKAFVRDQLVGVQNTIEPQLLPESTAADALAEAQATLAEANKKVADLLALAQQTGANTDSSLIEDTSSVAYLLEQYNTAVDNATVAQENYIQALEMTTGIIFPVSDAFTELRTDIEAYSKANSDFVDSLSGSLVLADDALEALGISLGLTGTSLASFITAMSDSEKAAGYLATLLGVPGASSADSLAAAIGLTGSELTNFISTINGTSISIDTQSIVDQFDLTEQAALALETMFTNTATAGDTLKALFGSTEDAESLGGKIGLTGQALTNFITDVGNLDKSSIISSIVSAFNLDGSPAAALELSLNNAGTAADTITKLLGTDKSQADTLASAIGLTGQAAVDFINNISGININPLQEALTDTTEGSLVYGLLNIGSKLGLSLTQLTEFSTAVKNLSYSLPTTLSSGTTTADGTGNETQTTAANSEINSIYEAVFGRTADSAGLDYWKNSGLSGSSLMTAILSGAQDTDVEKARLLGYDAGTISEKIESAYRTMFDRLPEMEEITYWLQQAVSNKWDGFTLFKAIRNGAIGSDLITAQLNGYDVGTNYVAEDMVAMIHRGEQIKPKAYVDVESQERAKTNELIAGLRSDIDKLRLVATDISTSTDKTNKAIQAVTRGGQRVYVSVES